MGQGGLVELFIPSNFGEFVALVNKIQKGENLTRIQAIYRVYDQLLSLAQNKCGVQLACSNNCAYCCYQMVPAGRSEWQAIRAYLQSRPDLRDLLVDRMQTQAAQWRTYLKTVPANAEHLLNAASDWAGKPCMFLETESNTCLVYAARPFACRAVVSQTKCRSLYDEVAGVANVPWNYWAYSLLFEEEGAGVRPFVVSPLQQWVLQDPID